MQQRELDAFKQQMEKEVLAELIQLLQHMNKFLADLPEGILEQLAKSFRIENYALGHVSASASSLSIMGFPFGDLITLACGAWYKSGHSDMGTVS